MGKIRFFRQHCISFYFISFCSITAMGDRNSMFLYFLFFEVACIASVVLTAIWILEYQVPISYLYITCKVTKMVTDSDFK